MSRSPRYTSHDGFLMPMGFPVEGFVSGLRYRARPGDVFVATYPKCGTTWMQHVIWLLANDGRPLSGGERLTDVFPHLEEVGRAVVQRLPEPRLIKTHLPFPMTPHHPAARYVSVARNPFDCAVSFFHHTRGFVHHYDFADGTFEDFFECFVAGRVDWGSYFEHLLSWAEKAERDNVLFTTFERMRSDLRAVVVDVGGFLGGAFADAAADPSILDAVLRHSSFGSMSRDQQRWSSQRPEGMPPFVRKGEVGDWENHFSPTQVRRLLEEWDRRLAHTRVADLWPDVLERAREVAED
jgi:hypothetical protein